MIKKSNKIAMTLLACGLLVGPMVLSQSHAFAEEINTELLATDNTVNETNDFGLSPKIKSSRNVYADNKATGDFRYIKGDGSDLRILSADAQNRSSSVMLLFKINGHWYNGSGTFVGNKTILTAAHVGYDTSLPNPTGTKNGLEEMYYLVDSNGPIKKDANGQFRPATGVIYKVSPANVKAFNESRLLKDGKLDKDWDIAVIHTEEAFPVVAEKHGMKFTDLSKLAAQETINNVKKDDPLIAHTYPGRRNVGDKNAGNLKESIEVGKQYTLSTNAIDKIAKPESDNHVQLYWNGTTIGGMSGSGMRNAKGEVIGIIEYATNETEDKGESKGFGGGMLLTPDLYNWVKSEIASTNQKGWVTVNNNKFYLDETTGNFIKNTTKAIDGHNWKFDEKGVASDLGAVETPKPSETKPSETPKLSETKPSETKPSETKPSETPKPSETHKPSETKPSETPKPSETKPSETPKPSETKPSDKPKPSETKPSETKPSDKKDEVKPSETPKSSDKKDEVKPSETKPSDKKDETKPSETPKSSDKKDDVKPSETKKSDESKSPDNSKSSDKKDEVKPSETKKSDENKASDNSKSSENSDKKDDTKKSEEVKPELIDKSDKSDKSENLDKSKANESTPKLNDSSKPSDKAETGDSKPELTDKSKAFDNLGNPEVNKSIPESKSDEKSDVKPDGQSSSLDNKSVNSSASQSGQNSAKQDLPKTNDVKVPLTISGIVLATAGFVALGYRKFFGKN